MNLTIAKVKVQITLRHEYCNYYYIKNEEIDMKNKIGTASLNQSIAELKIMGLKKAHEANIAFLNRLNRLSSTTSKKF